MKYVLSVDQSTQGTKALLIDENGGVVCRCDCEHRQIINEKGWISHDPEEIYAKLLSVVEAVIKKVGIATQDILCMGISNQRETSVVWEKERGKPICDAIVWQCSRATDICERINGEGFADFIQGRTGMPLSPYFPAAKLAWIMENIPGAKEKELCFGTIDSWLIYKLTGEYKTDFSNASRTQLFNISECCWDEEICKIFGMDAKKLPEVCASDSVFGMTDIGGLLESTIPLCGVMGDSHAALFGQGCLTPGMAKATYGTGSSVMMNIGDKAIISRHGLATSLAWKFGGRVQYVLEGNINYTGAVVTWLKDDVELISGAAQTEELALSADPQDTTYLVPAFTGLGAPYWNNTAKALLCGMTRLTGKAEIARAALDCIAYQITDVVRAMENDTGNELAQLRADGGPTANGYLMQFQSDITGREVCVSETQELSAIGAAYMAGIACGLWSVDVLEKLNRKKYTANMDTAVAKEKYSGWKNAVKMV